MLFKSTLPFLAFAQATRVYYNIQVDYEILGENDNHQAIHTYQKSENFDHAYDSLGTSMEASAEGWGASGSVAFAMSQMSDDTSSKKTIESLSQNRTTTFQRGRHQVWRRITKTMTIDSHSMSSTDRVYIYDYPRSNRQYNRHYWNQQAVRYLNLNLLPPGESTTRNNYIIEEFLPDKAKDTTDVLVLHTISVDYPVTGYKHTHFWQETYSYSETYMKTVREFATSASVSGGYNDFSASASFAYNKATSKTSYTAGESMNMNADTRNYPDGQYQIWRRVKETITINGKSSVSETVTPYNVRYEEDMTSDDPDDNTYSLDEIKSFEHYRWLANKYLKNTVLPEDVYDDKVHRQGATVYTKHTVVKGKELSEYFDVKKHWYKHVKYGEFMECPAGYVATGFCGSGQNADCENGRNGKGIYASLRCTKLSNYSNCDHYFNGYKYGVEGYCNDKTLNQVVVGYCGSGRDRNCKINRSPYTHANKCCTADNIDIDYDDTRKLYADHGIFRTCPDGYVLVMTCGSGRDANCERNHQTMICARARPNFASLG